MRLNTHELLGAIDMSAFDFNHSRLLKDRSSPRWCEARLGCVRGLWVRREVLLVLLLALLRPLLRLRLPWRSDRLLALQSGA